MNKPIIRMNVRVSAVFPVLTALGLVSSAWAGTFDWGNKGGGNLEDSTRYVWKSGTLPPTGSGDVIRFLYSYYSTPITVTLGQEGMGATFNIYDSAPEGKEWTKAVTLSGAGVSRHVVNSQIKHEGRGRELILDNFWLEADHAASGDKFNNNYGALYLLNGSQVDITRVSGARHYYGPQDGSRTIVDNSTFDIDYFYSPNLTCFDLKVRNGGSISMQQTAPSSSAMGKVRVVDGDVSLPGSASEYIQFLPERTGTASYNGGFDVPAAATSGNMRLGGTLAATSFNSHYADENVFYGRGKLSCTTVNLNNHPAAFDLSEMTFGTTYFGTSTLRFLGDTEIWPTTSACTFGGSVYIDGLLTVHVNPKDDAATERKCDIRDLKNYGRGAGISYVGTGLGSVSHQLLLGSNNNLAERLGSLSLDENVKVYVTGDGWYSQLRLHDLTLKAGSVLSVNQYDKFNQLSMTGVLNIDPTATINVKMHESPDIPRPLVTALDDDIPEGVVVCQNLKDGWEVGHNGGSWFYWQGSKGPGCDWGGCWLGTGEDCYWSNTSNWAQKTVPNNSGTQITISGFNQLVMTNDVENMKAKGIYFHGYYCPGPFIVRGKPIKLHSTTVGQSDGAAIYSTASYPEIFECDIESDKSVLGVTADFKRRDPDAAVLCFRSNVNVRAGTFAPCGDIVIDGTVNAKELQFVSMTGTQGTYGQPTAKAVRTELTVRNGGKVFVTDQTTANAATGHFWIAQGGAVSITGDWNCNTASNDHFVAGSLTVAGKLGGDASQTYLGPGTLAAAGTDGSDGATLKVGRGLTLAPTASTFGDMPIEILWGGATIAPTVDATLNQTVTVSGLGAKLVASGAQKLTLAATVEGEDFDIVKRGTGTLTLAATNAVEKGRLILESGTLAIAADQHFDEMETKPGATLAYDGESTVFLNDSVDLTGVSVDPLPSARSLAGFVEVVRVPRYCKITGVADDPSAKAKLRVVTNDDGTVSLTAKVRRGIAVIIR